jgi:hypothetical protein
MFDKTMNDGIHGHKPAGAGYGIRPTAIGTIPGAPLRTVVAFDTDEALAAAAKVKAEADAAAAAAAEAARVKAAQEAAEAAAAAADLEKRKQEGKLSETEAKLLKEVMEKKGKLKEAQEALKAYEGVDVAEFKKLKAAADEAEAAKKQAELAALEKAGEFDRVKKAMAEQHESELAKLKAQIAEAHKPVSELQKQIEELTVGQSFGNSQYLRDETILTPEKARVIYGSHFEIESGKIVPYDKPKGAASRTPLVDARGEPVSFEDAIKKIIESDKDKDALLRSKSKPGAASGTEGVRKREEGNTQAHGRDRIAAALAKK